MTNTKRLPSVGLFLFTVSLFFLFSCSRPLPQVNTDADGSAIKGYDAVAYFTEGRPVKGSMDFTYEWRGAKWRFASEEHLKLFMEDPEEYVPRYGGY